MTQENKRLTEQSLELAWKWLLRLTGLGGFIYLLLSHLGVPVAMYVMLGGMMGLPTVIEMQRTANKRKREERDE